MPTEAKLGVVIGIILIIFSAVTASRPGNFQPAAPTPAEASPQAQNPPPRLALP